MFITCIGDLLAGKLLIWYGLISSSEIMNMERSPEHRDCGSFQETR
jgi:hypothetical protein